MEHLEEMHLGDAAWATTVVSAEAEPRSSAFPSCLELLFAS